MNLAFELSVFRKESLSGHDLFDSNISSRTGICLNLRNKSHKHLYFILSIFIQSWRSLWKRRSSEQMWNMLQDGGEDLPGSAWRVSSILQGRLHALVQEVCHYCLRCHGVRQVLVRGRVSRLNDHNFARTPSVRR